jgi:hypothetical protein
VKGFVYAKKPYAQKSVIKGQRQQIDCFLTFVTPSYPQAVRCNTHLKHIILWSPPYETLHAGVYASSDSHFVRKLFNRRGSLRLKRATEIVINGPFRPLRGPQTRFDIVMRGRWATNYERCVESAGGACSAIDYSITMRADEKKPPLRAAFC